MIFRSILTRSYNIAARLLLNKFSPVLYSSKNKKYWNKLKKLYHGQRGFIICNGPSLQIGDLDKLTNEITIASNSVYLAFEQTKWRPTFFTVCDDLVAQKIHKQIHQYIDVVHAPINIGVKFNHCTTYYWKAFKAPRLPPNDKVLFSDNALFGFYGGYSVTYQNIQLAFHLGLKQIYLIGCDHNYKGVGESGAVKQITAETENHFIKGYRQKGEIVNAAPIERMNIAFQHARKFADNNGIQIFNATRGGYLEIFERTSFDKIIS